MMRESARDGRASASSSRARGRRPGGRARRSRARRWSRSRTTCPSSRSPSTGRSSGSSATSRRARSRSASRSASRGCRRRPRLQGGERRDRAAHQRALRLARRGARARPPDRRDAAAVTERAPRTTSSKSRSPSPSTCSARSRSSGFPNVGKSTLINRLTATRAGGRARDARHDARPQGARLRVGRQALPADRHGRRRHRRPEPVTRQIAEQARRRSARPTSCSSSSTRAPASRRATRSSPRSCARRRRPCSCSRTRSTTRRRTHLALEFHRLGLGDPFPLSGMHGPNTGDLLDEVVDAAAEASRERTVGDEAIRVAILGRPNVGKSSLFNALVGDERTIVSEVPGTTRDAIDTVLERDGRTFQLVDTAGLRRKRKQRQGIDYYSELRALEAAERADVALVLIDASEGIVEGDLAAAEVARKAHCSTLVVLSKWDISEVTIEDVRPELQRRLRQRPPFITTSAHDRPRHHARARQGRRALRQAREPHPDRRAEPLPRRAEGGAPAAVEGPQAAQPALRRAGHDAAAALPLHRQRHGPRHARLRLLGRERAARALRAGGRAGGDRLPEARRERRRRRRRLVGDGVLALLADRGLDVVLAARRDDRRRAVRRGRPRRRRGAEPRVPRGARPRARRGAAPQPHQGARPRDRRAALDARHGRPVAVLSGPEHGRGGRRRAAGRGRDRERGRRARARLQDALNSTVVPRLRERRPDRRRALRRREERDRARRRRVSTASASATTRRRR